MQREVGLCFIALWWSTKSIDSIFIGEFCSEFRQYTENSQLTSNFVFLKWWKLEWLIVTVDFSNCVYNWISELREIGMFVVYLDLLSNCYARDWHELRTVEMRTSKRRNWNFIFRGRRTPFLMSRETIALNFGWNWLFKKFTYRRLILRMME